MLADFLDKLAIVSQRTALGKPARHRRDANLQAAVDLLLFQISAEEVSVF